GNVRIADVYDRGVLELLHLRFDLPQLQNRALIGGLRRTVADRNLQVHAHQIVRELVLEHLALRGRKSLLSYRRRSPTSARYRRNAGESLAGILSKQSRGRPQSNPRRARVDSSVGDIDLLLQQLGPLLK